MTELSAIEIAMVAHEANRAYCECLGDKTQIPWWDAPDWQKESVTEGVKAIQADPTLTFEQSHAQWMERKLREGWKWGEVKSIERMEHPCLKPWEELPEEHKIKDLLFGAIVRVLMPAYPGMGACEAGPHQVQEETGPATPACAPDCCVTAPAEADVAQADAAPDPQESLGEPPKPQAQQPEQ